MKISATDISVSEYRKLSTELTKKTDCISRSTHEIRTIIEEDSGLTLEIVEKLKSVDGIANKINLLAINASIETIHASGLLSGFERIIAQNMLIQARLIARLLEFRQDMTNEELTELIRQCGVEELHLTDQEGYVTHSNVPGWIGIKLADSDVYRILEGSTEAVVLPAAGKLLEGVLFKVVAAARRDRPGLIQIGCRYQQPQGQLAIDGFGVVAQEAKRLADEAKQTAARIAEMLIDVNRSMEELDGLSSAAIDAVDNAADASSGNDLAITDASTGGYEAKEAEKYLSGAIGSIGLKLQDVGNGLEVMRKSFRGILGPLSEIIKVAKQTNLLGVRASIEAAHSTNDKKDFDMLLNKHMTIQARIAAFVLEAHPSMTCDEITELAGYAGVDEFWIAGGNAEVEITNIVGGVGFVYKNEGQTAPYLRILSDPDLVITMPPEMRTLDNKVFKYVAVGRKDKPGFLQVGRASKIYGESTAEGFAVVARQIKVLAEQSREIAAEVVEMIESMDNKAQKADEMIKSSSKAFSEAVGIINRLAKIN